MTALDTIVTQSPDAIYKALRKIIAVADKGSVITNDHCVGILIKLCGIKKYSKDAFSFLIEKLKSCPTNQLPMYAENSLGIINEENKTLFLKTLNTRLKEIEKDTKRKRVEKVISKVNKL